MTFHDEMMARMQKDDHQRVKQLLTDAITILCKNGLTYKAEFTIEGLLGITLDQNEIMLVNIKENIKFNKENESKADDHTIAQAVEAVATNCGLNFGNSPAKMLDFTSSLATSYGTTTVSKENDTPSVINLSDDEGDNDLGSLNLSDVSNLKCNDLDLLLANLGGQKKKDDTMDEATANSIFTNFELDQIIAGGPSDGKVHPNNEASSSESEQEEDVVVIKQEGVKRSRKRKHKANDSLDFDVDDIQATVSVIGEPPGDPNDLLVSTPKKDVYLPSCSSWEAEMEMPLNLTPTAQDLTTTKKKKDVGKHMCDECGKTYKSEISLKKHKSKEHDNEIAHDPLVGGVVVEAIEPLNLVTQPLDLTFRAELDVPGAMELGEAEQEQEVYACICGKEHLEYDQYMEHVAVCSKSKQTPYKSCEICGKYFFSNSGYVKHKRLHVGAYKFRCNICHKGFFDRTHMRAHMDSSHSKVRRYDCKSCTKKFFWKHHLKRHLLTCEKAKFGDSSLSKSQESEFPNQ